MENLEQRLGYHFRDTSLLEHALTHSSYANEHRSSGITSNERLEFLGDSILGLIVAEYLFRTHPNMPEGELTRTRAALVCEDSLHEVALTLKLGRYLRRRAHPAVHSRRCHGGDPGCGLSGRRL